MNETEPREADTEPVLPPLDMGEVRSFWHNDNGSPDPLYEEWLRDWALSYGLSCYAAGVEAERARCFKIAAEYDSEPLKHDLAAVHVADMVSGYIAIAIRKGPK